MKQDYDIRVNPPRLSKAQIEKHKDFSALLAQYQASAEGQAKTLEASQDKQGRGRFSPAWWLRYGLGSALALGAASVLIFFIGNLNFSEELADFAPPIQPPLPELWAEQAKNGQQIILADKGDTLRRPSAKLIVPAKAFVNQKGEEVKGEVSVEYHYLQDPVQWFASGLLQDKKQDQFIHTLGSVYILAFQNGEPLRLKAGENLEVELETEVSAELNLAAVQAEWYQGAQTSQEGGWGASVSPVELEILGASGAMASASSEALDKALQAHRQKIERQFPKPQAPVKPEMPDPDRAAIDVSLNPKEFPELAAYRDKVQWESLDEINPAWADITWDTVSLVRKNENEYQIMFKTDNQEIRLNVVPVLKNWQEAQRLYQEKKQAYDLALEERNAKLEQAFYALRDSLQKNLVQTEPSNSKRLRQRFKVPRLGLWNCGSKNGEQKQPVLAEAKVNFSQNGQSLALSQVFVFYPNQHWFYMSARQNPSSEIALRLAQGKTKQVWALDEKQQLWILENPEETNAKAWQFKAVAAGEQENALRELIRSKDTKRTG